jgi:MFS family permease
VTEPLVDAEPRTPIAVLAAAFLFNLGQGVLRPALPLYLQRSLAANYRMVTAIPVVFGAGKWVASLPTGYLLDRLGRSLMIWGLLLLALVDFASIMTATYGVFLGLRGLGGVGWAMFATVATTVTVNAPTAQRRGRAVSLLLMSETSGLLLGSAGGGWLYAALGPTSPFVFEAACMLVAAATVARWASLPTPRAAVPRALRVRGILGAVLRAPGVCLMGVTSATLVGIQTGVLVFLFPLYLVTRGGISPQAAGLLISLGVLGRLLALWCGGSASDRWGRMQVLVPGLLAYAVSLGSLAVLTHPVALSIWSLVIGAAAGIVTPLPPAIVGDQAPPPLRGVAVGWLRMMSDSGQIVGPLVMGALADASDLSAPFLLGAALLALTAWQCHRRAGAMAAPAPAGHGNS